MFPKRNPFKIGKPRPAGPRHIFSAERPELEFHMFKGRKVFCHRDQWYIILSTPEGAMNLVPVCIGAVEETIERGVSEQVGVVLQFTEEFQKLLDKT